MTTALPCPRCEFDVSIGRQDSEIVTCPVCGLESEVHMDSMLFEGQEQTCLLLEPLTTELPE